MATTSRSPGLREPASRVRIPAGANADQVQTAHDLVISRYGEGYVEFTPGVYELAGQTIEWQNNKVGAVGNAAVLRWATLGSGNAAIRFRQLNASVPEGTDTSNGQVTKEISGLKFSGPGLATGSIGMLCDTTTATFSSRVHMRDCRIGRFGVGWQDINRAYLHHIENTHIYLNGIGYESLAGDDSGENIRFIGGLFSDNNTAVKATSRAVQLGFFGTSFDFNNEYVFDLNEGGRVTLHACHIEGTSAEANAFDGWLLRTYVNKHTQFLMEGGELWLGGTAPHSYAHVITHNSQRGFVRFRDVVMHNLRNSADLFCSGVGLITVEGSFRNSGTWPLPFRLSDGERSTSLIDGGFENATLSRDLIWLSSVTTQTTKFASANASIASSETNPRTGTRSLLFTKTSAGSTAANLNIAIPIRPGAAVCVSGYLRSLTGTYSNIGIAVRFIQILGEDPVTGAPIIGNDAIGGATASGVANTAGYTLFQVAATIDDPAPAWATHAVLRVEGWQLNNDALRVDDINISVY